MKTRLVEFQNQENEILRGIITLPEKSASSGAIFLHGFGGGKSGASRRVSVDAPGALPQDAVFLQGFERNATVEKKFKMTASTLAGRGVASLRYDASGCGLSDGDFSKTTLAKRSGELLKAIEVVKEKCGAGKINFIAHSMGMCPLALVVDKIAPMIGKMVFIAPALNQKELMRYYFVRDSMKRKYPEIIVNWKNFRQYLNEEEFLNDCRRQGRMARENYIDAGYFMETANLDFTHSFDSLKDKILHVHGDYDHSVPLESLEVVFPNRIIIPGGDHDLERPDFWEQWFFKAVDFLTQ